jgi:hypothetical protein
MAVPLAQSVALETKKGKDSFILAPVPRQVQKQSVVRYIQLNGESSAGEMTLVV